MKTDSTPTQKVEKFWLYASDLFIKEKRRSDKIAFNLIQKLFQN
jgi:hypothetical protein